MAGFLPTAVRSAPAKSMRSLQLLHRLIGRPLLAEPSRTVLTILAVALGVAVIVAIDLAGEASAGSFRSSMETLQGQADYEIHQVGGVPEALFGELSRLPEALHVSARIEGFAVAPASGERVPVFGVDLLGDPMLGDWNALPARGLTDLLDSRAVWVSASLGKARGDRIDLILNDRTETFSVQEVLQESDFDDTWLESMVLMDLALAQRVLDRTGSLDRIYVQVPTGDDRDWTEFFEEHLPPSAVLSPSGIRTQQNRKMLNAFRWNLRVLSYIALIVGAFLIYNTVSVSVVRRRPQIGVVRALGASRRMVRMAFLAEGCFLGALGTALGLPMGRVLAAVAVEAMGQTVQSLYVSSTPGTIAIRSWTVAVSVCAGIGVSLASAWWPAREAASVPPTEAMAKARLEYETFGSKGASAKRAAACAALAAGLCLLPPWDRIPMAGYLAALGLIASVAMLIPQVTASTLRAAARPLALPLGVAAVVGARSLSASLRRTSVMVAALSTATAMMVSVGIMVGSFRETVILWMDNQLRADLYVRPEGRSGTGDAPTLSEQAAQRIEGLRDVEAVDRYRAYAISYGGLPATLAMGDVRIHGDRSEIRFLEGPHPHVVWERLTSGNSLIVSETFSRKHDIHVGDTVELPIGPTGEEFEVAGVFYDYSGEQGYLIGDRAILLQYLPDPRLTSLAVYLEPGVDSKDARRNVGRAVAGRSLQVVPNRQLRERAITVFDRTFAITYALEAVAVIVAILGMAGALLTLVIDRRTELGVLRVLGASKDQIRRLVLTQAGLLGLISTVSGSLLGGALSLVLIKVINKQSFGWTIQFHWPLGFLLAALGVIYLASLAAGVYPARIAASRDPIEVLHEE